MTQRRMYTVAPSAARLTGSLRDIGYDLPAAVADLVDNSIAASATRVEVIFDAEHAEPRILIADDGCGMGANTLTEALRFGSRRSYGARDLGRYGLGLKTASLSQGRRLTVVSRRRLDGPVVARRLDLDLIEEFDDWLIVQPEASGSVAQAHGLLNEQLNTVVVWEHLDRLLPGRRDTGHARRRMESLKARTREHLAMVFHRFLDGSASRRVAISVNGEKVGPWDPFATTEPATLELSRQAFEVAVGEVSGTVQLRRWVLPARHRFSGPAEFERAAGPLKWNRQQGIYVYRADRLVQWGGWGGIRALDEHTKLARCALDFDTDLDSAFNINVAKMRVSLPAALRPMLERPVQELCQSAEDAYRTSPEQRRPGVSESREHGVGTVDAVAGLALLSAAVQADRLEALREIATVLRVQAPETAAALGLDGL